MLATSQVNSSKPLSHSMKGGKKHIYSAPHPVRNTVKSFKRSTTTFALIDTWTQENKLMARLQYI